MRIEFSSAMAVCLFVATTGCPSETVGPPPEPPVNWQSFDAGPKKGVGLAAATLRERAVPDAYTAALASADFAALIRLTDDDAHFTFPGMEDAHGPDAIVRVHQRLLGAFDQRKVTMSRVWRTSSEQTVEWTLTGIQARDWMGIKASQKPVTIKGVTLIWTKDDGSVTDLHLYFDVAVVKAQLGVGPKDLVSAAQAAAPSGNAGPPATAEVFEQASSAAEQGNIAVARAALDALEKNDLAAYQGTMADDVEVSTLERAQPWRGKADAGSYFKAMHKSLGQLDTTVTDSWGVGAFAVLEYTIAGEQLGPFGWIPAQRDKTVLFHIVDIVEVTAGKIAHVWRYDNPGEIVPPS
jgi:ketosteroid isomerase-like protein